MSSVIHQKPYERIVYVLRRDGITFVPKIVFFVFLLILPAGVYQMTDTLFPQLVAKEVVRTLFVLFASMYILSVIVFFYTQFVIFYLDLWIVTNDRIVDIEQAGLFSRTVSEFDLYNIQDVTSEVNGFFPTLFRFGNLHVKTASINTELVFRNIPHPDKIRQELLRLADEDRKYHVSAH